ncbi:MAG: SRPBCC domain-containing protein [Proteobacteria bacterium]|nr:SRPBCC domain-containing protein [Pseudomonadota bacterium]
MIIEGSFTVAAPIDKLFDFMLKPESIMTCVPGTESVRVIDDTTYECVVKQKVGIITAKLKFVNKMTKIEKPTHIEIEGEGEDVTKLGHFKNKTSVDLKEVSPGTVEVTYKSNVSIVGKLAMFGDRIMRAKAKDTEKEFTKNLQAKLKTLV